MSKKYELTKKELQEIEGGVAPIMVAIPGEGKRHLL